MHLPPNAQVYGSDGHLGHATQLVIDPTNKEVTHLVVKEDGFSGHKHLVPFNLITETVPNQITISCDHKTFEACQTFTETQFVNVDNIYLDYGNWDYWGWPYTSYIAGPHEVEVERIPEGELALKRGMSVNASDGHIGRIDEFVVDAQTGRIGHLIMRQGHIFGEKDVFIPVSDIKTITDNQVLLNLNKHEVEQLEHIPVNRLWENESVNDKH